MQILFIQTILRNHDGAQFAAPYRVPDKTLKAFVKRLANDGIVLAEQLTLSPPDGYGTQVIIDARKTGLTLAAIGVVTLHRHAVRNAQPAEAA